MKIKELIPYLIIIIIIIIIRSFVFTTIRVNGASMSETLHHNDIMILNLFEYKFNEPKRLDIIGIDVNGTKLIKRIIGLPNDTIRIKDNVLYINDQEFKEEYIKKITKDFDLSEIGYDVIPKDMYFVLGDNRDNSVDSRIFGLVKKENIIGKTVLKIFPF